MQGKFIVLEGLDGAGKTATIEALKQQMSPEFLSKTVFVREPGGTELAEKIRAVLLSVPTNQIDKISNLLLFGAARADVTSKIILPALEAGKHVISDRYTPSTVAYQGAGTNVNSYLMMDVNQLTSYEIVYNMSVIFLDISLDTMKQREKKGDARDQESGWFYERVYQSYQHQKVVNNWYCVDAEQPLSQVVEDVIQHIITIVGK